MVRQSLQLITSPRCRRGLGHGALALALLCPTFIVLLDHHGAERIPGHQHAAPPVLAIPGHPHDFERDHAHTAVAPLPLATAAFVPAQPAALVGLASIDHLGLPVVALLAAAAAASGTAIPRVARLADQIALHPPTPPPTASA